MNDDLKNALSEYVFAPEDARNNFNVAIEYEKLNQLAAAVSFFLRCADRSTDNYLTYVSLIKAAKCFEIQENRQVTVKCLYKHAICFLPRRPEAYFLLARHYEWNKQYSECYMLCEIALNVCDFNLHNMPNDIEYPGKYGILFEKAVSAWWWGKSMESRKLFHEIADNHYEELTDQYRIAVQNNLTNLGSGPESQAFRYYHNSHYDKLRYKFPDSEKIERNYSQVFQDIFVLSMTNGKRNGTYLEIGSARPFIGNNTALLETLYGWNGIGIEHDQQLCEEYRSYRKNSVICKDATKINYYKLLEEIAVDNVVDYLQLDCEPSQTTFEILLNIPFDKYKFAVITYEHDHYVDITHSYREKSRKYLELMGYQLVVNDVSPDGISTFEDWWVHPELVDKDILMKMTDVDDKVKHIEKYFLN